MTFKFCKLLIEKGRYVKEDMLYKLDIFLLANRITDEQYAELVGMINATETVTEEPATV